MWAKCVFDLLHEFFGEKIDLELKINWALKNIENIQNPLKIAFMVNSFKFGKRRFIIIFYHFKKQRNKFKKSSKFIKINKKISF